MLKTVCQQVSIFVYHLLNLVYQSNNIQIHFHVFVWIKYWVWLCNILNPLVNRRFFMTIWSTIPLLFMVLTKTFCWMLCCSWHTEQDILLPCIAFISEPERPGFRRRDEVSTVLLSNRRFKRLAPLEVSDSLCSITVKDKCSNEFHMAPKIEDNIVAGAVMTSSRRTATVCSRTIHYSWKWATILQMWL